MIGLIGIDHQSASVSERSAFSLSASEASMLIEDWQACGLLRGAVVLSTCNRMEIYYEAEGVCHSAVERRLTSSLLSNLELSPRLASKLKGQRGEEAMRHLFRLASGLESMVVGETQILGQLKEAYRQDSASGLCTPLLSRLFHRAFEVGKRIRSEYLVSASPLSAGSAAVDKLLRDAPHCLEGETLIIGAGLMAETIYHRLVELGARGINVYNRTRERAERFAQAHPKARVYCERELGEVLLRSQTIFVATSAPSPIVLRGHLEAEGGHQGERYIFDLAVPRNVEEAVGRLPGVHLYSIDALGEMGLVLSSEIEEAAHAIIDEHLDLFVRWTEGAHLRETISTLQRTTSWLTERELSSLPHDLSEAERQLISRYDEHLRITITTALVSALRKVSDEGQRSRYVEVIDDLCQHILGEGR